MLSRGGGTTYRKQRSEQNSNMNKEKIGQTIIAVAVEAEWKPTEAIREWR